MMGESAFFGVYLHAELVTGAIALALTWGVHRVLVFFGLSRHIWHRPLFETALFLILWSVVLMIPPFSLA